MNNDFEIFGQHTDEQNREPEIPEIIIVRDEEDAPTPNSLAPTAKIAESIGGRCDCGLDLGGIQGMELLSQHRCVCFDNSQGKHQQTENAAKARKGSSHRYE